MNLNQNVTKHFNPNACADGQQTYAVNGHCAAHACGNPNGAHTACQSGNPTAKQALHSRPMQLLLALMLSLSVLFALTLTAHAADYPLVNDEAGLLTESEVARLQEKAEEYSEYWQQDIVIYTTNDIGNLSAMEAADDYFDYNGFGQGSNYSGVVLLLDMGGREYWISTTGDSITYITDYGIEYIGDEIINELSNGYYADAFDAYLDAVDYLFNQAASGKVYDVSGASNHSSSSSSGQDWSYVFTMAFGTASMIAIVFCVFFIMQLHSKARKRSAADYVAGRGLNLTRSRDLYLYSNTRRVRKQENNGGGGGRGGSSTHRGSSGRSHGGGGGRF